MVSVRFKAWQTEIRKTELSISIMSQMSTFCGFCVMAMLKRSHSVVVEEDSAATCFSTGPKLEKEKKKKKMEVLSNHLFVYTYVKTFHHLRKKNTPSLRL